MGAVELLLELEVTPRPTYTQRLDQIRARVDQATPGPWRVENPRNVSNDYGSSSCDGITAASGRELIITDSGYYPPGVADAEFIAHAREDIPFLLAEIDRLSGARRPSGESSLLCPDVPDEDGGGLWPDECNGYTASCGRIFCTLEAAMLHDRARHTTR